MNSNQFEQLGGSLVQELVCYCILVYGIPTSFCTCGGARKKGKVKGIANSCRKYIEVIIVVSPINP